MLWASNSNVSNFTPVRWRTNKLSSLANICVYSFTLWKTSADNKWQLNIINIRCHQVNDKNMVMLVKRPFYQGLFWSRQYPALFLLIGRIFAKIVGNLLALSSTTLYLQGKIWCELLSPQRVGYRKSDRLLFFNMSARGRPLKVPLFCSPSGAFV